jgi:hypothetical protein
MSGPLDFRDEEERRDPPRETERRPEAPPPARPPNVSKYTWFVGVVAFLVLILVTVSAVDNQGAEPGGPVRDERLIPFAAPLAAAPPRADGQEDANLDSERACRVRGEGIFNMCDEAERGPVVLAIFPTEAGRCASVMDQFDRLARRMPDVRFVAVGARGDRDDLRGDEHPFPVVWDRDGSVATVYGLVGCPQITFAREGGQVVTTTRRELTDAELRERVSRLRR